MQIFRTAFRIAFIALYLRERSTLDNPRLVLLKHELTVLSGVTFVVFHCPVAGLP